MRDLILHTQNTILTGRHCATDHTTNLGLAILAVFLRTIHSLASYTFWSTDVTITIIERNGVDNKMLTSTKHM